MHCGTWLRSKTKSLFLDFFHRFTHFGHGCSITHVKRFSFLLCSLDLIFCCDGGFSLHTHTLPVQFVSCSRVKKKMTHFHTRGNWFWKMFFWKRFWLSTFSCGKWLTDTDLLYFKQHCAPIQYFTIFIDILSTYKCLELCFWKELYFCVIDF